MGYIAPNTTIQLFKGIKLYPGEENTAWFDTAALQDTYFTQKIYASIPNNTYQRINNNTLKIKLDDTVSGADRAIKNLYDVNYMRFKNINYENKWIYAFVTKVEYINNVTVQIEYEIDSVQTWLKDYAFEYSFIDRQHARSDDYFSNLVPENLDTGDYISENSASYRFSNGLGSLALYRVALIASRTPDGRQPRGNYILGQYMPLVMYGDDFTAISNLIESYNDPSTDSSPDDIVAVYMYPSEFGIINTPNNQFPQLWYDDQFSLHPSLTTIDGYTPKNKKLFTYPYKFLRLTNLQGGQCDCIYEGWTTGYSGATAEALSLLIGKFNIWGTAMPPASAICMPLDYNGSSSSIDMGIVINNFPQCAWIGDTFKAWWAQNKAATVTGLISSAVSNFTGAATNFLRPGGSFSGSDSANQYMQEWKNYSIKSGLINATVSTGVNVANKLAQISDLKNASDHVNGAISAESLLSSWVGYQYVIRSMTIRGQIAKKIDEYFDLYGYAQHTIAKPDPTARENWTYIKTIGCQIDGDIPAEMANDICMRFDSGIRFWKNPDRIGDYSMSNNPMGYEP